MRLLLLPTKNNLDVTSSLSYIEKYKKSGTKRQLKRALSRWAYFIATKGYNKKEVGTFVDNNGTITRVANHIFTEFAEFLDNDNNMSFNVLNNSLHWMQHVVSIEVEHFN